MTVINTTATPTATAYSNQRKIDRCQNGVLWSGHINGTTAEFLYSLDNGVTWTAVGSSVIGGYTNFSFFIDLDDYAHFVGKNSSNNYIYYYRGTPNAARTAWTWSTAQTIYTDVNGNHPDVIAHREGTGWVAHIVFTHTQSPNNYAIYRSVTIDSAGTFTVGAVATLGGSYNVVVDTWPSIDFNHTGDGKTVAGGTPHLYAAWSAGATGAGKGIRFKRATYSAGAWTWGTEREIDSTAYIPSSAYWINCLFDGTTVNIVGFCWTGSAFKILIYERNVADTSTVTLWTSTPANYEAIASGSSTYDSNRNIYLVGRTTDGVNGTRALHIWKFDRTGVTLSTVLTPDTTAPDDSYVSVKRSYSNSRIELLRTDGTSSPYSVVYDSYNLNQAPNVPTALTVISDSLDTTPVFQAAVSDPDTSQQIKARFTIYQSDGVSEVGTVDSTLTAGSHTASKEYASALPIGNYFVAASTVDDAGLVSAQTAQVAFAIKTAVAEDLEVLWETDALVEINLNFLWDVLIANQKDFSLSWNVKEQAVASIVLEWSTYTPWVEVSPDPESPVVWERVLT